MIGFSGFGSSRKPRQFNYKPRHFDPEAAEKQQMRKVILGEDTDSDEYKPGVLIRQGRIRRIQRQSDNTTNKARRGIIRTAIFLVLVSLVLFFMADIIVSAFVK